MIMRVHYFNLLAFLLFSLLLSIGSFSACAQYPGFDAPETRSSVSGAAGLVAVNPSVDGGSVPIGATAQVVVLFRNEGSQPIQTGKINLYPSSNISAGVSLDQCASDGELPSGAECALAISVKGLQAGAWRLEMLMLHSGRTRLVTATLSGSVDANGDSSDKLSSDIETIPDEIKFGSLGAGQAMVEPVILRNITSNPIKITDLSINAGRGSGYSVETDCDELQAGQACIATVTWSPLQKGPATGVLVVKHNGPTALASVSLSGDYSPDGVEEAEMFPDAVPGKGLLVSSQVDVDFGSGIESASTITVSLVNAGDSAVTLNEIKISGSNNGLSVATSGCAAGLVLEAIEACPLTLTWSPTRIGSLLDDIQILHNGARGVLVLPIRGAADAVVSQDQKAIVLTRAEPTRVIGSDDVTGTNNNYTDNKPKPSPSQSSGSSYTSQGGAANAASTLDGLKITSFATTRAIVNGPGGSRLVFDGEAAMLGGVVWDVHIQKNGIEFSNGEDRILLLFDRSLSSVNRVSGQSSTNTASTTDAQ